MNNAVSVEVANQDNEQDNDEIIWKSCCLRSQRDAVVYFSVYAVIIIVLGFCFYQLIHLQDCNSQQQYLAIVSLVLGIILPQPSIRKNT